MKNGWKFIKLISLIPTETRSSIYKMWKYGEDDFSIWETDDLNDDSSGYSSRGTSEVLMEEFPHLHEEIIKFKNETKTNINLETMKHEFVIIDKDGTFECANCGLRYTDNNSYDINCDINCHGSSTINRYGNKVGVHTPKDSEMYKDILTQNTLWEFEDESWHNNATDSVFEKSEFFRVWFPNEDEEIEGFSIEGIWENHEANLEEWQEKYDSLPSLLTRLGSKNFFSKINDISLTINKSKMKQITIVIDVEEFKSESNFMSSIIDECDSEDRQRNLSMKINKEVSETHRKILAEFKNDLNKQLAPFKLEFSDENNSDNKLGYTKHKIFLDMHDPSSSSSRAYTINIEGKKYNRDTYKESKYDTFNGEYDLIIARGYSSDWRYVNNVDEALEIMRKKLKKHYLENVK